MNNAHKFERWLRHGLTVVATTYGPITFGLQSCLLLKETNDAQGKSSHSEYVNLIC